MNNTQAKELIEKSCDDLVKLSKSLIDQYNKGERGTAELINAFLMEFYSRVATIKTASSFIEDKNEKDSARNSR